MERFEMQRMWEKELESLKEIALPNSLEWADVNKPNAREYIEKTYSAVLKAIVLEDERGFSRGVQSYTKAWIRLWQLMAIEHFDCKNIMDVDIRYYRHMPDGHSMTWTSSVLDKTFKVYPRKPKKPQDGELWMTAGEMVRIHENPSIMLVLKEFDGWFDRDEEERNKSTLERALEHAKKNPPSVKLKIDRRDKHGFEWFK